MDRAISNTVGADAHTQSVDRDNAHDETGSITERRDTIQI